MAFSARALRASLAVVGLMLVAVIAGLILIGRARIGNPLKNLPRELGVDIEQDSDNFTLSRSREGHTLYTLHAAKELQHKDGKVTLKNVGIVLYGQKGDRHDEIHGDDFEYDQAHGTLHANGTVFIDLAAPRKLATEDAQSAAVADEAHIIHIRTSGMTFTQKTQIATTDQEVEFRISELTGYSVGATYDAGNGTVVLNSAVRVAGLRNGRPVNLTARHAELDQRSEVAVLETAKYVSATDSGSETAAADHAVVRMDQDGTPRHIDANGHVALGGSGHGTVTGNVLELGLSATGQPQNGHLYQNVGYVNQDPMHLAVGQAEDARVAFDSAGNPHGVNLTGAVSMTEKAGPKERRLEAAKVNLSLSGGGRQPLVVRSGQAFSAPGSQSRAWLRLVDANRNGRDGHGSLTIDIRAESLTGRFAAASSKTRLDGLDGVGQTEVERVERDAKGVAETDDTSLGKTLKIDLRDDANGHLELASAEQHGQVQITRTTARKAAGLKAGSPAAIGPETEHARADAEIYNADEDVATLTGSVAISDANDALFADRAELDRRAGVSTATGNVRVSYADPNNAAAEPVHVIAARAVSTQATGLTEFTSAASFNHGRARMWQGSSQVEAPVLDLNRTRKTLLAHGASADASPVRTVLVEDDRAISPASKTGPAAARSGQDKRPVLVLSDTLDYSDATRQAVFTGHVRVDNPDGTMLADQATAYLLPAERVAASAAAAPALLGGGRLERIVGIGQVHIRQPGRTGTGERIVYTADDQTFVLTGTRALPPKIVDEERGDVTGALLRFRSEDKTVFVESDADHKRVSTETKLKQ